MNTKGSEGRKFFRPYNQQLHCTLTGRATKWRIGPVIPAYAGIYPLPHLDAGLRRHDEKEAFYLQLGNKPSRKSRWAIR